MSHLASADDADSQQNGDQLSEMRRIAEEFPAFDVCFANSGGVFLGSEYHGVLARPGIALYGGEAVNDAPNPMRPVATAEARIVMIREAGTTDIPTLLVYNFPPEMQTWLWLAFFASLAVKMPMWPVHTWLPDASTEARPATAVLLVGVLDKVGTYGMIRFCLSLFPEASAWATPVITVLAVISVLYGALLAIGQAHQAARRVEAGGLDQGSAGFVGLLEFIEVDRPCG